MMVHVGLFMVVQMLQHVIMMQLQHVMMALVNLHHVQDVLTHQLVTMILLQLLMTVHV